MLNERNLQYVISQFGSDYVIANEQAGEIAYECPFCPEHGIHKSGRKLYVNVNKLKYNCFRCESRGSLAHNLSKEFDRSDVYDTLLNYFTEDKKNEDEETTYFNISPMRLIDYKDSTAYRYMRSRGFTDEDIDKYSMRIPQMDSPLTGRVIVPNKIISKNWTDMYVARTFIGHSNRYKNPSNSRKSELLFNYHNIPDNPEYMILNEGPLNSIIAGDLSVASFGKTLSQYQRQMIFDKHPKKLYVSYDIDAIEKTIKLCDDLIGLSHIEIYLVELPEVDGKGLDAVDLGREKYLDIVFNSQRFINSRMYNIMKAI